MRCSRELALGLALFVGWACRERAPAYTTSDVPDVTNVSTTVLSFSVDTLTSTARRVRMDVFLGGDVTSERATALVSRMLDSLQRANPEVTILRAVGFMMDFGSAKEERVPLVPVLEAVHMPINGDTLTSRPGAMFRTHVNLSGKLPTEAR